MRSKRRNNKKKSAGKAQFTFGFEGGSGKARSHRRAERSGAVAKEAARRPAAGKRKRDAAPPRTRSRRSGETVADTLARQQRDISVSEFFAKNRHLLGFDNKRKALLMTVKEAVDNALDACEEADQLPEIEVRVEQLGEDRFRVTVCDNGPGIVEGQIPNIFGKLLYGSKFHRLKMSRGQQGIGISAAGMYGLLTTGKSIRITSRTTPTKPAHHYEIQIDTKKNAPHVVRDETLEVEWERGTRVSIELVASYAKGRQSVDEYLELTGIANPHASITYLSPTGERIDSPRATEVMPKQTKAIQPHPYGIELGVLIRMLHDTKSHWLSGFLCGEFSRVGPKVANAVCEKAKLNPRAHPRRIARHEAETLYEAIQATKIMAPPTDCLAPIGAEQILAGLLKGVKAEFFTAATRPPAVYRGNPFQMEVGLAYGGDLGPDRNRVGNDGQPLEKSGKNGRGRGAPGARVIRLANRVPLLYQQSACSTFKSVLDIDWRRYGLSQSSGALPDAPIVIMVHMASVWVPFTSESKEAIADYDEIRKEIRLGLMECGRKLGAYLNRRKRQHYEGQRRGIFERYINEVVEACATIKRVNRERLTRDLRAIALEVTARADEALGPDAKPKRKAAAAAANDGEFGENTVVIDRAGEAKPEPDAELFER